MEGVRLGLCFESTVRQDGDSKAEVPGSQRGVNAGRELTFSSFPFSPGLQPVGQCLPH